MSEVTVRMACGCVVPWSATAQEPPVCPQHGERKVATVKAPPPRFRFT